METGLSSAMLAPTIKRVAKNTFEFIKKKNQIKVKMEETKSKYEALLNTKLAELQAEYDQLDAQQELFEKPVRELTGGYGTEDLVTMEIVDNGTSSNGRALRSTVFTLKYPDTIVPTPEVSDPAVNPHEVTDPVSNPGFIPHIDTSGSFESYQTDIPFGIKPEDKEEENEDDLPF